MRKVLSVVTVLAVLTVAAGCRQKASVPAAPQSVGGVPAPQESRAAANTLYTCPMHPEVFSLEEGQCPKCNMALTPKQVEAIYTCPMHPEVVSDKPGQCPKCNMTLAKKG